MRLAALLLLQLGLLAGVATAQAGEGAWRSGRATFYGTDAWSIHEGSCHYGYIWPGEPLGWDVAAISDTNYAFIGSCGRCYEVQCLPSKFTDGYGSPLDRTGVCFNPNASVVVRITDTCPCVYPGNAYSNRRWCCGDMDHLDISVWAFEKLADKRWGVIGMRYRPVPCNYSPAVVAPSPASPSPGQAPPSGAKNPHRGWNWQEYGDNAVSTQWASQPHNLWLNGPQASWSVSAGGAAVLNATNSLGIRGGANAACASVGTEGGHLDFVSATAGPLVGASTLNFWVHSEEPFGLPAIWLQLLTAEGTTACRRVRLEDLAPVQRSLSGTANPDSPTSWVRFVVGLPTFQDACTSGPSLDGAFSSATAQHNTTFVGCSGAPLERLAGFRFASALAGTAQVMCLDGVRLVSNAGAAQGS